MRSQKGAMIPEDCHQMHGSISSHDALCIPQSLADVHDGFLIDHLQHVRANPGKTVSQASDGFTAHVSSLCLEDSLQRSIA